MKAKGIIWIVILVLFLGLAAAAWFIEIDTVTVTGNKTVSSEDIEADIFDCNELSRKTCYQVVMQILNKKVSIPFVEDYKIIFKSLTEAEVIVYEKSIVGFVTYMNNYMYFDKDGIIVDSSTERIPGIPEVLGLKFGSIVLYRPLPVDDSEIFYDILTLTQALQNHNIDVEAIEYSNIKDATLYLGDIVVKLGTNSGITGQISELADMLPNLRERMASEGIESGTLYLDNYSDNAQNSTYTFKRN